MTMEEILFVFMPIVAFLLRRQALQVGLALLTILLLRTKRVQEMSSEVEAPNEECIEHEL